MSVIIIIVGKNVLTIHANRFDFMDQNFAGQISNVYGIGPLQPFYKLGGKPQPPNKFLPSSPSSFCPAPQQVFPSPQQVFADTPFKV